MSDGAGTQTPTVPDGRAAVHGKGTGVLGRIRDNGSGTEPIWGKVAKGVLE